MAKDIILLDGVRYLRYTPKSEAEFERIVIRNASDIFGNEAIYLDIKTKIANALGESTIPDGYLFYPGEKRFVILEIELSSHGVYSHVSKQISKFISAIGNYRSRQKLASALRDYLETDALLIERMRGFIKGKGLYEYLLNDVFEPLYESKNFEIIVIIEYKTERVIEALSCLNPKPEIIEIAIYAREGSEAVKALCFTPNWDIEKYARETDSVKGVEIPWKKEDFRDFVTRLGSGAKCIFWFVACSDKPLYKKDLDDLLVRTLDREIAPQTVGGFLASVGFQLKRYLDRPYPLKGDLDKEKDWKLYYYFENKQLKMWAREFLAGFAKEKGLMV